METSRGDWAKIPPIISTNTQKVIHSVKLHISHQMKPYLSVNAISGSIYTCFVYLQIGESWRNLAQLPPIMGRDTLKAIQSVKFHISHQMKSYSRVKAIYRSSYTCFSIFGELRQVGQIKPKYPTSSKLTQRKSFKVLNSAFHITWIPTQV